MAVEELQNNLAKLVRGPSTSETNWKPSAAFELSFFENNGEGGGTLCNEFG